MYLYGFKAKVICNDKKGKGLLTAPTKIREKPKILRKSQKQREIT